MTVPAKRCGLTAWSVIMDEKRVSETTLHRRKEEGNEEESSISDQINKDEIGMASCMCREKRNSYRELGDKYEGNSPHGRLRYRWLRENKPDLK